MVKPCHSLVKGLLLGKLLKLLGRIAADGKSMRHAREEVDLIWMPQTLENLLGFVALLGREDAIGLGGRDGQRSSDAFQLLLLDEARMSKVANLDAVLVVTCDVLFVIKR